MMYYEISSWRSLYDIHLDAYITYVLLKHKKWWSLCNPFYWLMHTKKNQINLANFCKSFIMFRMTNSKWFDYFMNIFSRRVLWPVSNWGSLSFWDQAAPWVVAYNVSLLTIVAIPCDQIPNYSMYSCLWLMFFSLKCIINNLCTTIAYCKNSFDPNIL